MTRFFRQKNLPETIRQEKERLLKVLEHEFKTHKLEKKKKNYLKKYKGIRFFGNPILNLIFFKLFFFHGFFRKT